MNILLCTTSMGYGGAETHICNLADELLRAGHRVTVASEGGELVGELPGRVKHIKLPPFSKSPYGIVRSSLALGRLIRRGNFDVVHAHARLPAFICRRHARRRGCVFVVTAHALFRMTPLLCRLSAWGEKTIAVSEDIKQHLIESCGIYSGHINVIPNGIDTNRFSPPGNRPEIARRILFVSRMDSDCSLGAELLCRIAGRLDDEFPGIKITLAGGGRDLERIRALSEAVNAVRGQDIIEVLGAVTDIERLLHHADIFVGVSRAALEAASSSLPVILCGNEGYAGILSPGGAAAHSNFCGRGCKKPDAETLLLDIRKLLGMSAEERRALGDCGRDYVMKNNSSKATSLAVAEVYSSVPRRTLQKRGAGGRCGVVICGYYGFGNTGDNAILDAIISRLRKYCPAAGIVVMAASTKKCRDRFRVSCVSRTNLFSVFGALLRSSHFILGGGTLLQDATSSRSLSFYLAVSRLARAARCRIIIAGSGLGPLYRRHSRRAVSSLLKNADFIGLREPSAHDLLRSLGVLLRGVSVSGDLALLTERAPDSRVDFLMSKFVGKGSGGTDDRYIAVALCESGERGRRRSDTASFFRIAAALDKICKLTRSIPLFFNLSRGDNTVTEQVRELMSNRGVVLPRLTPPEICGVLSRCLVAVGMRLHLLIFALSVSTPAAGIAKDPKISAFLDYAGLPAPVPADVGSPGALISLTVGLAESRDEISPRLLARQKQLSKLADAELRAISKMIRGE